MLDKATKGPEDEPFDEEHVLVPTDSFFVHYSWVLEDGHTYHAGDTVTFELPKALRIIQAMQGTLEDDQGVSFATYQVATNGTVTFTFTEAVDEMSAISGDFYMKSQLRLEEAEIEDGKVIIEQIGGNGQLEIPIQTPELKANLSKGGKPLPTFSPTEIEWTITVDTNKMKHQNGRVVDTLPAGLTYKANSMKVDGQAYDSFQLIGQNIEIELGDIKGTKTITFVTTIEQEKWNATSFSNKATYEANKVEKVEASATVKVDRGKPVQKKGGRYNPTTKEIEWEIALNFDGKTESNTILQDTWKAGLMELVGNSLTFYDVTMNDKGQATITNKAEVPYTVTKSTDSGFDLTLPTIDKPYIVKYKTKLKDRLLNGQNIQNNVQWNGHTSKGNVWAEQGVGSKGHSNVNYKNKTVDWYLIANTDKQDMKQFVIQDEIGNGLTLKESTVVVKVGNKVLTKERDYTFTKTANGFTVTFIGPYEVIKDKVEVRYTTTFDYTKLQPGQPFMNYATYTWLTGDQNVPWKKEVSDGFTPDDFTKYDGNKTGYYDARNKTITWSVSVNYQQNEHEQLIMKDLIQGNQKLIPDTIQVHEGVLGGGNNSIWAGDVVEQAKIETFTDDGKSGFQVYLGKTNKPYVITYQTSLANLNYIAKNYTNVANIYDGERHITDLRADVGIMHGGEFGKKSGYQNGKAIDWSIVINGSQASIHHAVVTDTLSSNQELIKDSVQVYTTTVDNYGNITKAARYDDIDFQVKEGNPQTFNIVFKKPIEQAYILEYSTMYFASDGEVVSNDFNVTGENIGSEGENGHTVNVTINQTSGGSATGKVGYLHVQKVASDDRQQKLEGVTFELIDPQSKKVLKTGVTDANGEIDFGRLMFGQYLLKEIEAPEGYVTLSEPILVKIDQPYVKGDEQKRGNVLTVENDREVRKALIYKYEPDGTYLPGAEFKIVNDQGETVQQQLITRQDGTVETETLEPGTYQLIETKAPPGYQKLQEPSIFTIEKGKSTPVILYVPNVKLGDILLEKKDALTGELLAGVTFELQKYNEEMKVFEAVERYTTNEGGAIAAKDLENGQYQFVEVAPLEGYLPLQEPLSFEVSDETKHLQLEALNTLDETIQKVVKVDAEDETKRLAGAQFELYKVEEDGERRLVLNGEQTYFETDKAGEVTFTHLTEGAYVFIETKSPSGYERAQVEYGFIVGDGQVEPIIVSNTLKLVNMVLFQVLG